MKHKLLNKLLTLALLTLGGVINPAWAADPSVTFTFNTDEGIAALGITKPSKSSGTNLSTSSPYTLSGVSISVTNGTGTATRVWNSSGTLDLRIYSGSKFTFTAPGNIKSIVLAGTTVGGFTADGGTFSSGTWTGNAASVTLTSKGTERINTIKVTYAEPTTVATPTFSVAAGTYNTTKSVELNCATASATIYYTTDGTTPTTSSSVYSSAIAVNTTATIKAFAVKDGLDDSEVASATYTLKCATPTISVPSGVFVSSKVVTMESSDGASIYYTNDGSTTPTSSSTAYDPSNKPSISATTTIKAIATKSGWSDSDVATQTFTKETVLEGISGLNSNTVTTEKTYYVNFTNAQVTWTGTESSKSIAYINDGSAGIYVYNLSLTLNTTYNGVWKIKSKSYSGLPEITGITSIAGEGTSAVTSAMSPTVMTPSALDDAFTANLCRQIQITNFTVPEGKKLTEYITLYGTDPYTAVTVGKTYTLVGYPYVVSSTKTFRVTQAIEKPSAPTFDPAEGEFGADFELTITAATGSTIYYTTNGDTPTASSTEYDPDNKPTISAGADVTVKAIAVLAGMTSDVGSATYEYKVVSKPTFDPANGTSVYYGETVAIACDVDGSTIYYTTDGSTPTSSSSVYSTPIAITANSVTIKALAKKGDDESSVASATFTLKTPDAPTASPVAGAVETGTSVALNSRAGTSIYYTLDGTTPSSSSTAYTGAITIDAAKTIKAIAYDGAGNYSSVLEAAYTIFKVATPTFGTATGQFAESMEVTISCETDGAAIYYTTNGDTPTSSSTLYEGAFEITATTTVKAIATKANCTNSDVASVTYTKATLYTVADVIKGGLSGSIFVKGYIVGEYVGSSTNPRTSSFTTNSNIAIADEFTTSPTASGSIPIQLPTGSALQTAYGLSANGTFGLGKRIIVYGSAETYFSVNGIKSTSSIKTISECVTVTAEGYATYASTNALDFTDKDIDAYIATTKGDGTGVTFTQINKVPANTGVLLHYTGGKTEEIPVFDGTGAESTTGNKFVKGTGATVSSDDGTNYNYILNNVEDVLGFYKANDKKVAKNRAYISILKSESAAVKEFISLPGFDDDADSINEELRIKNEESSEGAIYNLAGQRISKMQKGINIINGKKVLR